MEAEGGLRSKKKQRTRQRIADVAAELFAQRGYDAVTMLDVARAAEVSDQTVYNYFAAKQDLVLDRADQFRVLYRDAVEHRTAEISPAAALLPLLELDVERYRESDLGRARGEFLAQSVESAVLRRFTLQEREAQARIITEAITATTPQLPNIVAHWHASAIVAVIQTIHDQIGTNVLNRNSQAEAADGMLAPLHIAITSLDRTFANLLENAATTPH
ncbi:TetR/AcrR family transcriptional regulator [Nocardioides alkalitolerans]|uniref:TetR/AcrR family transcriptional regulator n=1 Tax=Nocardioides alkalitolerans TaxID=281714 RepID=UPI00069407D0|nr:TetR/AcrR family transcriptional regulator [Nocardioides alkalitolerans]